MKKEKLKYHIDLSIQTLCYDMAQVPSIFLYHLEMFLHTCPHNTDNAYQSQNQATRSRKLPAELRDMIV